MAIGLPTSESGGVMAPADLRGAGEVEWAITSGIEPTNPLVGGPSWDEYGFDVDRGRSRIVTTPEGQMGPTGGVMAPATPALSHADSWRDIFNFRGSPMPWLLIASLLVLGFMEFRVQARAGRGRVSLAAS